MMTVGSLFSGIGGIDLGLERAGMTVAWQCEKDEAPRRVLAHRWPNVPCYDDVTTLKGPDVPRVDVLCGGFPCQDLSVAGRRAGLAGERSGLFHEFMRLADELAPRWVLVENVPGLLSSNNGADMGVVLETLADLGYGWCYRVLDAQYFGVAQRRRRVFIVGCAGDPRRAAQVLFEPSCCDRDSPPRRQAGEGVAGTLGGGSGSRGWAPDTDRMTFVPAPISVGRGSDTLYAHDLAQPITGRHADPGHVAYSTKLHNTESNQAGKFYEEYAPSLQAGSPPPAIAYNPYRTLEKDGSITSGFAERAVVDALHGPTGNKEPLVLSDTVRSHPRPGSNSVGNIAVDGMAVRRLMPIECERLQGFPDGWTDGLEGIDRYDGKRGSQGLPGGIAESIRYRMLGNAVCVPVAEWIGRRIVEVAG